MTLADADDRVLAARAQAGEQAAYAMLMQRHRDAMWRLARGHVGDADQALDITQDAFIAAFAAIGRYDASRPFRAWMARITINKCRDWARRRAVRRFFTLAKPLDEATHVADLSASPEEALASADAVARINAAIAALPANLKEVLLLRTIEIMSQADTAHLLGISEKAVETRLYRARSKLSEMLRDGSGERV